MLRFPLHNDLGGGYEIYPQELFPSPFLFPLVFGAERGALTKDRPCPSSSRAGPSTANEKR